MLDLTRLRTPAEVCASVAASSRGTATAEQIALGHRASAGHHFYYGFCLAVFVWSHQTRPEQSVGAAARAWNLPSSALLTAVGTLNRDAELEPFKIMQDVAAALWPEHPLYRGGPTHG